jgi:hypothetical protein
MRVYVIYGQGGFITSAGMYLLGQRIAAEWTSAIVSYHRWRYPNSIINDINQQPETHKIVLIGYSLGANCVTWVSNGTKRKIDLAVCYDPSVLTLVRQPSDNVARLLLYHNNDFEPEGHAVFTGPQVETTQIRMFHLAICYSQMLHAKTLNAVWRLAEH